MNVAVTVMLLCKFTVQIVPLALLQPDQVEKEEDPEGVAVRVIVVPIVNVLLQVAPTLHVIPGGLLVTVPVAPVPAAEVT